MPTWKCPKCGSTETYKGTVLHEELQGSSGVGLSGMEMGDTGISPILGKSSFESNTVERTVVYCKKCDIQLGEKDKVYSPSEQRARAEKIKEEKRSEEKSGNAVAIFILFSIVVFGGVFVALPEVPGWLQVTGYFCIGIPILLVITLFLGSDQSSSTKIYISLFVIFILLTFWYKIAEAGSISRRPCALCMSSDHVDSLEVDFRREDFKKYASVKTGFNTYQAAFNTNQVYNKGVEAESSFYGFVEGFEGINVWMCDDCFFDSVDKNSNAHVDSFEWSQILRRLEESINQPEEKTRKSFYIIFGIATGIVAMLLLYLLNKKKNPKKNLMSPKSSNKNKIQVKNLVNCGAAVAQLVSENKVMIFGGSEEEKEAVRQWVQENHPEYDIS
jgi:hypothetical protein